MLTHLAERLQQHRAQRAGNEPTRLALEQIHPDAALQTAQPSADRRLSRSQGARRGTERTMPSHGVHHFEVVPTQRIHTANNTDSYRLPKSGKPGDWKIWSGPTGRFFPPGGQ